MKPLLASPVPEGFPMTILLSGTPLAAIWKTAVCGQVLDEVVRRFAHVVYSLAPSVCGLRVSVRMRSMTED